MTNNFKIAYCSMFKFYKNKNKGIHLDDQWAFHQIREFERKVFYKQKWVRADITTLQCESTITPNALQLRTATNGVQKSFDWTKVVDGGSYGIYQCTYNVTDVPKGTYYLYGKTAFLDAINWEYISEPIDIQDSHVNTLLIKYRNSYNRDDVAWTTGLTMAFRVECDVQDFEPGMDKVDYINQVRDSEILDATAYRRFNFNIADFPGVPNWAIDILNRIWCLDHVDVQDKLYVNPSGKEMKVNRVKGYPLVGATLEITEAVNQMSLEFQDVDNVSDTMVNGYNIETAFFGGIGIVPVTEILIAK